MPQLSRATHSWVGVDDRDDRASGEPATAGGEQTATLPFPPPTAALDDPSAFDSLLGPSNGRYFGSGYRRVRHRVKELSIHRGPDGSLLVTALGAAAYPADWSAGGDGALRLPHLSTIDAIVLAVTAAEAYLRSVDGLGDSEIAHVWIADIDIRAGAVPWDLLDAIPVKCSRTAHEAVPGGMESTFTSRIAAMTVVLRVRTAPTARTILQSREPYSRAPFKIVPGPLTDGYRHATHPVSLERITPSDSIVMHARHGVRAGGADAYAGLEGAYWPSATIIDCLVVSSQMAQALIFAAPGLNRSSVSNLWMRRARFTATVPPAQADVENVALRIVRSKSFARGEDGTLNSVDVECPELFGFAASASLAFTVQAST